MINMYWNAEEHSYSPSPYYRLDSAKIALTHFGTLVGPSLCWFRYDGSFRGPSGSIMPRDTVFTIKDYLRFLKVRVYE